MNKIIEKCAWCEEDLSMFQSLKFEGKLINCPLCNNQYLVEYDDNCYSYFLKKCINGETVNSICIKRYSNKK